MYLTAARGRAAYDISVRDVQRWHRGRWPKGMNFGAHLPIRPWIVTADEPGDPHDLRICLRVNGVVKQDSSTHNTVFKLPRRTGEFSAGMALEPGAMIITGTPEGVGRVRNPPEFLKVRDVAEAEIERIGLLRNSVAADHASES